MQVSVSVHYLCKMKYGLKVWNFIKENIWLIVPVLIIFLFVFGGFDRIKLWLQQNRTIGGETDPEVTSDYIHANFHGSLLGFQPNFFNTNENNVKNIINSLPSQKDFNNVVTAYRKSYGKDLREELVTQLGKIYDQLIYK